MQGAVPLQQNWSEILELGCESNSGRGTTFCTGTQGVDNQLNIKYFFKYISRFQYTFCCVIIWWTFTMISEISYHSKCQRNDIYHTMIWYGKSFINFCRSFIKFDKAP